MGIENPEQEGSVESLAHDVAYVTTHSIMEACPQWFAKDRAKAFFAVYSRVKAGVEAGFLHNLQQQLKPTPN